MNRLLEPNREGGYPLVGEALSILGSDIPAYINSILDRITPTRSVVFLNDSFAFVKKGAYVEIMQYTLDSVTIPQLINGEGSISTISDITANDIINDTTYEDTRCSRTITIKSASVTPGEPTYYDLESLLKYKLFNEADYIGQLSATSQSITGGITIKGHAILKGGMADISLILEFTGSGGISIELPNALRSRAIVNMAYQDPDGTGNNVDYPIAKIINTRLTVAVAADNQAGGHVTVHFHYMPIPSSLELPYPNPGGVAPSIQ